MITLILFDAGETLLHGEMPFPHVVDALEMISGFTTQAGPKLKLGIVSNFGDPAKIESEVQIRSLETEFAEILQHAGIESFFQPFESRVTISARARALKPDRVIFETAAERSGAKLSECLFITETRDHLGKAKILGMSILGFGDMEPELPSFSEWLDAPARIAGIVTPEHGQNFEKALALQLKQRKGIGAFKCLSRENTGVFRGQGTRMLALQRPELGDLNGTFVEMRVDVSGSCDAGGRITSVDVDEPAGEDFAEAASSIQRMARRGQLSASSEVVTPATTHVVETDAEGRRVLVRKRYANG